MTERFPSFHIHNIKVKKIDTDLGNTVMMQKTINTFVLKDNLFGTPLQAEKENELTAVHQRVV